MARKSILNNTSAHRKDITPQTKLKNIIPNKNRKEIWKKLLSEMTQGEAIWAPLKRSRKLKLSMWAIALLLVFPILLYKTYYNFSLAFLGTVAFSVIMITSTTWAKTDFPEEYKTVGDLAKIVGSLDYKVWSEEETFQKLKKIISEQLDISEDNIKPDSDFINDLGVG